MMSRLIPGMLCLGVLIASLGEGPVYLQFEQDTPPPSGEPSTTPAASTDLPSVPSSPATTATPTETPVATATPSVTEEPYETPNLTITPTPEETRHPEMPGTATLTAEPTSTPAQLLAGFARYQNRAPDQAGITVVVLSAGQTVLASTATDAQGLYEIAAPAGEFYWLLIDAPLHQLAALSMWSDSPLPETITLAGGDLDDDTCINNTDLALLTAHFGAEHSESTDINGDDRTDLEDLAILSGNYDPECIPMPGLLPTATPTGMPDVTLTPTLVFETALLTTDEP